MSITARYYDGLVAKPRDVNLYYEAGATGGIIFLYAKDTQKELTRWHGSSLSVVPSRKGELRLTSSDAHDDARIVVSGATEIARVRATLPILEERQRNERGRQVRIAALATAALGVVIAAYAYGVPLIASRLVQLVPPGWEEAIGATVATQMEASLGGDAGLPLCDANPESVANRAIARFAETVVSDVGVPFDIDVRVVKSDVPNAFALPGGRVYFFSALLNAARTPDEFAGVLAHEIGHVAHRHGMEQLISTAGTGALIGFILGDMTGISVAAGLGSTIIDARFSREAEREADRFAAQVAQRMDFDPAGLALLIGRIGEDDAFSRALALLSTHPLTEDRRIALEELGRARPTGLEPPFTADEWAAIRDMCKARTKVK